MVRPGNLVQAVPLNRVKVTLLSTRFRLEWTLQDLSVEFGVVSIGLLAVIWEVISCKNTGSIAPVLMVTVNTELVVELGNSAIIHLDLQIAVVRIVPIYPGVFANAPSNKGFFVVVTAVQVNICAKGSASHVGWTILADSIFIGVGHINEVSDDIVCWNFAMTSRDLTGPAMILPASNVFICPGRVCCIALTVVIVNIDTSKVCSL